MSGQTPRASGTQPLGEAGSPLQNAGELLAAPPGGDAAAAPPRDPALDAWPHVDRRKTPDRRAAPTPFWSAFLGLRRRQTGRRAGESEDIYVDRFTGRDVALVVAILVLNVFDAFCTLIWVHRGGAEGNPLMAWVLDLGIGMFVVEKCFVVGGSLLLLVVHKNFRFARLGLRSLATVYSLLILYHFALMASGIDPRGLIS